MAWDDDAFRIPSDALASDFVTAVYSAKVINYVRSNLVAVATCNTTWKAQLAKGSIVYIPVMTSNAAQDVSPLTSFLAAAKVLGVGSATPASIDIDKWKEAYTMIDDSTAAQSNVTNLLDIMADNAAYELLKAVDITVNTLYSSLTTTWRGSDGQTFSDDILIALMEGLDEADVPRQGRSLVCDPSTIADIYKIDKFMSYDYNQTVFTTDAFRGNINSYKLPVFCSNNLYGTSQTGANGALLQTDAIGLAMQSEPKVEKFRAADYHSDVINISCFYGAAVIRKTFGATFYTRSK